jgi:ribose/xylose/arabinose/galactoside ABC-type transport system permease subunit
LTVSEESHRVDGVRATASCPGFRAAAPALLIALSLILVFVGERFAPGFATVTNMLQLAKLASFLGVAATRSSSIPHAER